LALIVLAAVFAGCGSSSSGTHESSGPATTTADVTSMGRAPGMASRAHLAPPCSARARRTLARYGSVQATRYTAPSGDRGCHLEVRGGGPDVIVELDSAPQAYVRMEREQVEYWQNVEWSDKPARAAPRPVGHLGLGAYWFPLEGRLLSTDGVRIVSVKVRSGIASPSARKSLAVRLNRSYLGPSRLPPGY
jgi:hypothetical protein